MTERVSRDWGYYEDHYRSDFCVFKTLVIEPRRAISFQRHKYRDEFWFVASGAARVRLNDAIFVMSKGATFSVPAWTWHRVECIGDIPLVCHETQTGFCREDDIERRELP